MKHVDFLIGNTSSGIIEAASFHKPVVNIGDRQKGRLQSGNVIDCNLQTLPKAIQNALSKEFQNRCRTITNIYGNGHACDIIIETVSETELSVVKKFVDIGQ
jgi:UDP-N-acetylglucosamine 2-epimerase